jgi:hypothetical protein
MPAQTFRVRVSSECPLSFEGFPPTMRGSLALTHASCPLESLSRSTPIHLRLRTLSAPSGKVGTWDICCLTAAHPSEALSVRIDLDGEVRIEVSGEGELDIAGTVLLESAESTAFQFMPMEL